MELPYRALEGVRTRRIFAILIDLIFLSILVGIFVILLAILGIPTLGLAWFLIPVVFAGFPIVALLYNGITISGWRKATPGMRVMDLEVSFNDGTPVSFIYASAHAILFYLTVTFLTPFILLVSLLASEKRCLHDLLTEITVTRRSI